MSLRSFEILSQLGSGTFSQVYKVRRLSDRQVYALKQVPLSTLSLRDRDNSLNEVRILASISHPNIISYRESFVDQESNSLCIIMEFADCGDLSQCIKNMLRSKECFAEGEIWRILAQLARGLSALHELNILHRDLKAANVFLTSDGQVKIGDLNVSKEAKNGMLTTQTGTPHYASPEVWSDRPYSFKSDIWSLGCVTYEMSALRTPFAAGDMAGLYQQVTKGKYAPLPAHYSQALGAIVKSMLQTNPHFRPNCRKLLELMENMGKIDRKAAVNAANLLRKTLRFPMNIDGVKSQLPSPRYTPSPTKRKLKKLSSDLDSAVGGKLSPRTLSLPRMDESETPGKGAKQNVVGRLPKIFRMPPPKICA